MSEKRKKVRLYKYAAEFNLSTEKIVEFLNEKGFSIKSTMSPLTSEMLDAIEDRFKKDIDDAKKHYKKIDDFQKKFSTKEEKVEEKKIEKAPIEEVVEVEKETETVEEEIKEVSVEDPTIEEPKEEKQIGLKILGKIDLEEKTVKKTKAEKILEKEKLKQEKAKLKKQEATEAKIEADVKAKEIEKQKEAEKSAPVIEKEKFVTDSERELDEKEVGLKVLGKIDLEDRSKRKGKKKKSKDDKAGRSKNETKKETPEAGKEIKEEKVDSTKTQQDGAPKKKRLKAKKRKDESETDDVPTKKKKKKVKKFEIDSKEVKANIKKTMLAMDEDSTIVDRASFRKKRKKEKAIEQEKIQEELERESSILKVTEFIAVNELANLMNVPVSEVISKCIGLGLMVSINQRLDFETITLVADEFNFDVEMQHEIEEDLLVDTEDNDEDLEWRPPVVTIMGHVDHGKTSLLDYIRSTNVVAGEAGGITQHIGAYHVKVNDRFITFLDTPGHEAFTAMRARGAQVTDIVILIVSADDAVMPQTIEAINHAQAAGVPMIVAINKIDKPGANVEKIKQQLSERNVLIEEWGGKYQAVEISAKKGTNIDVLLDTILLEAEMLDLKANPNRKARGSVIEAQLEKGRGVVATVLVQKGTLNIGDPFVAGIHNGRVRAMFDERNKKVKNAGPSVPVVVTGFEGVPQAGDQFVIVDSEKEAHEVSIKRQQIKREQDQRQVHMLTLDEVALQISKGQVQDLNIVVKGDVDGSVEALADSFMKLSNEEVRVRVIHKGVGAISESDVLLAAASQAIIIGFHVRPHLAARKLAETEKIEIRLYNIIYDAIEELKSALEGMLRPIISEQVVATVEIRDTFKVPKVGTVAGCFVVDGKINRNDKIRLFRDGIAIYQGDLSTLKRFKDDVKEVDQGYECGLNIHNFNDIKVGDTIEAYKIVETKQKLK